MKNPSTGQSVTKYYYAGATRLATRTNGTLSYLLADHLGSTSLVTDAAGTVISDTKYKAWGEVRYSSGANPSKYTYTGQYSHAAEFGLLFYNARWYDPSLSRFASADFIVPDGVQGYDRFAYVSNNPVRYTDPSGHDPSLNNCDYAGIGCQIDTYTLAGIYTQSPFGNAERPGSAIRNMPEWLQQAIDKNPYYIGIGPAKVTDAQMEAKAGSLINKGKNGIGLGLRLKGTCNSSTCEYDQSNWDVAVVAMRTRIALRTDICAEYGCTSTDEFLVAALAQNESLSPQELRQGFNKYRNFNPDTTIIDWEAFFASPILVDDSIHNERLVGVFMEDTIQLERQGYLIPNINWSYIYKLLQ